MGAQSPAHLSFIDRRRRPASLGQSPVETNYVSYLLNINRDCIHRFIPRYRPTMAADGGQST